MLLSYATVGCNFRICCTICMWGTLIWNNLDTLSNVQFQGVTKSIKPTTMLASCKKDTTKQFARGSQIEWLQTICNVFILFIHFMLPSSLSFVLIMHITQFMVYIYVHSIFVTLKLYIFGVWIVQGSKLHWLKQCVKLHKGRQICPKMLASQSWFINMQCARGFRNRVTTATSLVYSPTSCCFDRYKKILLCMAILFLEPLEHVQFQGVEK